MSSGDADMAMPVSSGSYSAHVRIELRVNGQRIPVAQTGGGNLIFDQPISLTATTGEVVMTVDGRERRWRVTLHPRGEAERVIAAEFETG